MPYDQAYDTLYRMPGHIILKLGMHLENSTKNMIPTHRNILFNRPSYKHSSVGTLSAKILIYKCFSNL